MKRHNLIWISLSLAVLLSLAGLRPTAHAASVDSVSVSGDGSNIFITFSGSSWYLDQDLMTLQYADGTAKTYKVIVGSSVMLKQNGWEDVPNVTGECSRNGESYTATLTIPVSTLISTDVTLVFSGQKFTAAAMGLTSGATEEPEIPTEPDTPTASPTETVGGSITLDGALGDWVNVAALASGDSAVESWKAVRDADGNVYFCFTGTAVSQWDSNYQWKTLSVTQNGQTVSAQFGNFAWTGGSVVMVNEANGTTAGPYYVEGMLPASYFSDPNFTLTFANVSITADQLQTLDGNAAQTGGDAVYDGIVIDGSFSDWDAVVKSAASCPNSAHLNCIDGTAMLLDGDRVYLYLHEASGGSAAGAGSHSNGQYAITTDLGRELLFQLTRDGAVSGVDGAQAKHVGAQWEISIPVSALPQYRESLSFGLYQQEPFVTGVTNLDGSGGNVTQTEPIVIDGSYSDWDGYQHERIDYATAGTQETVVDSEGALYSDGTKLYAHVETTMPAHLNAKGGDFLAAISVAFNGDRAYKSYPSDGNFYPRIIAVGTDGTITTLNEGTRLENGTYTFYICDTRTASGSTVFAELADSEIFGTMMVTVNGVCDQMEFELDLEKVAAYIGADATDFQQIDVQFGRLGQKWLSVAGVSAGPWVGVALCLLTVGGGMLFRRRRQARQNRRTA
jgi:hypothetical protein